jgi:hypothetical protein
LFEPESGGRQSARALPSAGSSKGVCAPKSIRWFVIELLFFWLLAAISAESLFGACEALRSF